MNKIFLFKFFVLTWLFLIQGALSAEARYKLTGELTLKSRNQEFSEAEIEIVDPELVKLLKKAFVPKHYGPNVEISMSLMCDADSCRIVEPRRSR